MISPCSEDITDDVRKVIPSLPAEIARCMSLVAEEKYPPVDGVAPYVDPVVCAECKTCDFRKHNATRVPADHVYYLGLHHSKLKRLLGAGIRSVGDVPDETPMSDKERLRFEAYRTGRPAVSAELAVRLSEIRYPAYMLDFETLRPDIPIFPGHSPFMLLPFQWSNHTLAAQPDESTSDSSAGHDEFVHEEQSDPREAFVSSLLTLLATGGSIVHYHGYERHVIDELVECGVKDAEKLQAMFDRFVDLQAILADSYADAGFLGKTSIKNVLPVVAPHLSYKSLAIQNGDQAQIEYQRTLTGELSRDESQEVYSQLKLYCKLDTWAKVEVLKALYQASASPPDQPRPYIY